MYYLIQGGLYDLWFHVRVACMMYDLIQGGCMIYDLMSGRLYDVWPNVSVAVWFIT